MKRTNSHHFRYERPSKSQYNGVETGGRWRCKKFSWFATAYTCSTVAIDFRIFDRRTEAGIKLKCEIGKQNLTNLGGWNEKCAWGKILTAAYFVRGTCVRTALRVARASWQHPKTDGNDMGVTRNDVTDELP
jgi:hypothetical protein